jgi:hypothetical protein
LLGSWLQRILGFAFGKSKPPVEPAPPFDEVVEELSQYIDQKIAGGFATRDEVVGDAVAVVGYPHYEPAVLRPFAERCADAALAAHAAREAEWTMQTDCDRLDAAFAALEADGVISRQNFSCCGTCGSGEIWDEMEEAANAGRPSRGYAFYHMQDTDSAAGGGGLYLNYGSREDTNEAAVAIGHEIVAHLNRHGLQTDWDGRIERRICVPLDWKRRRQQTQA